MSKDNVDGSDSDFSVDKGGSAADAGMIVSDDTDSAEYECKGSTNEASYGTDSAEDNDNALDKEMAILNICEHTRL